MTVAVEAPPPLATGASVAAKLLPSPALEYLLYAQWLYSLVAPAFGISISGVGSVMLAGVAVACVLRMGKGAPALLAPAALPLACGICYVAIQVLVHGQSVRADYVRDFVPWMTSVVAVQALALRRGFLHRSSAVILLIGLTTIPFMRSFAYDDTRTGLEQGIGIANPNDLGAWFGFCCVYLTVLGLETRRMWLRGTAWALSFGCLLVVGLTVSRAPLFAAACSIAFAFRRVLKRGFLPFLSLILAGWVVFASGAFDRSAAMYGQRGLEDTGRVSVWPRAIARIVDSPLVGVGAFNLGTMRPGGEGLVTPHNAFIFLGLASGVVPLLLFVCYWGRIAGDVMRAAAARHEDTAFLTALALYSFLIVLTLNEPFMLPWMMSTLGASTAAGLLLRVRTQSRGARAPLFVKGDRVPTVAASPRSA